MSSSRKRSFVERSSLPRGWESYEYSIGTGTGSAALSGIPPPSSASSYPRRQHSTFRPTILAPSQSGGFFIDLTGDDDDDDNDGRCLRWENKNGLLVNMRKFYYV